MRGPLLALLLPAVGVAQEPTVASPGAGARVPSSSTAVHRGWLKEVLEGDLEGAATLYEDAANDDSVPDELRALALARRVELERLRPGAPELQELYTQLVDLLNLRGDNVARTLSGFGTAGLPVPMEGLLEAVRSGEPALQDWLQSAREGRRLDPVNTRPLVPALYDLFVAELARARQSGDDVASRRFVRELSQPSSRGRLRRAVVILDMVLGGEEGRADRLRQGLGYQPVPMPSDPVAALRTARSRLESELTRVDLNPLERRVLGRLRARLIEFGDDRATEAVEMLRNLPVYGEMLLSLRQR